MACHVVVAREKPSAYAQETLFFSMGCHVIFQVVWVLEGPWTSIPGTRMIFLRGQSSTIVMLEEMSFCLLLISENDVMGITFVFVSILAGPTRFRSI
jgi:hypothetical protein